MLTIVFSDEQALPAQLLYRARQAGFKYCSLQSDQIMDCPEYYLSYWGTAGVLEQLHAASQFLFLYTGV